MVSQCANPECGAQFLYFGQGQLVAVPRRNKLTESRVEFFWLCGNCADLLNMEVTLDGAVNLIRRPLPAESAGRRRHEIGGELRLAG